MRDAALRPRPADPSPPARPANKQSWWNHPCWLDAGVLLLLAVVAVAITWPWAAHPLTTIIALNDPHTGTTNVDAVINMSFGGWMRFSLLDLHHWPFSWTPWLAFPDGASHATSYDSPLSGFLTGLLYLFLPLGVAYSVMQLLAFVLCGFVCYRLAAGWWGRGGLALAVGLTAECCPFLYQRTLGHANLIHIWTIPLAIGLFERWRSRADDALGNTAGMEGGASVAWGLSFPLMVLSSWYLFLIGMIYQGLATLVFVWRRRTMPRSARGPLLRRLAWAWGLGLGGVVLLALPMMRDYGGRERVSIETMAQYSTPLAQYLMPFPDSPLGALAPVRGLQARLGTHWEATTGIPLVCLILLLVFLFRRGRASEDRWVYGLTAAAAVLISLGPFLQLTHALPPGSGPPMPAYFLARLSGVFSLFKVPGRVHILVFFIALFAAGRLLHEWRGRWPARAVWPALLAGFVALNLVWSVPLGRGLVAPLPPVPGFYQTLGAQPGRATRPGRAVRPDRGAILDAPFDDYHTPLYSYYQLWHKRPIVGATLFHDALQWRSRRYVNQRPGVCFFRTYNEQFANWWVAGLVCQPAFLQDLAQNGIEFVIIHPAYVRALTADGRLAAATAGLYARFESAWRDRLVYADDLIRVYRVK